MKLNKIQLAQNIIKAQEGDRPELFQQHFGDVVELIDQIKAIDINTSLRRNHGLISKANDMARWCNRDAQQERASNNS